jgi:hypothetical protein
MIDRHYGHLARDSREHAVSLLDALAVERAVDPRVDVARNARNAAYQQGFEASPNATPEAGGRSVDVEPARTRQERQQTQRSSRLKHEAL